MDPTAMMSDGPYAAEIWGQFGQVMGRFAEDNVSAERGALGNGSRAGSIINVNGAIDCEGKRVKTRGSREDNLDSETEPEANSSKPEENNTKPAVPPKQDYIHVRARRGQATDSHSLAERARREKISERMKILQDLVPGCNKVIGKASVLDEIINYIQSLQRQVEFLSLKLEAINSGMDPGIQGFSSKDAYDNPRVAFGSRSTRDYGKDSPPEWLHMQLGGGYERAT